MRYLTLLFLALAGCSKTYTLKTCMDELRHRSGGDEHKYTTKEERLEQEYYELGLFKLCKDNNNNPDKAIETLTKMAKEDK